MKDLKCGLRECKHNKGYSCVAKQIQVDSTTDCDTYEPRQQDTMFESAEDFAPKANFSVDTAVACSADCIFNRNNKCISNGITVMSSADCSAACLTFIKN